MSRPRNETTKRPCSTAFHQGRVAGVCGLSRYNNPYRRGEPEWDQWLAGWLAGTVWR